MGGFKTLELQSFNTSSMCQYSFQKLRILVVLKRQYKIVLKLHKNARFKTAFSSIFVTKIHNFCHNNPFFCIFETIFGGLIRYSRTPRNISIIITFEIVEVNFTNKVFSHLHEDLSLCAS